MLFIVSLSVLVLEGTRQTSSDRLYRGLYLVNEILKVVRELFLTVAEIESVSQAYEMHRCSSFQLDDLCSSPAKEALMFWTFESHRVRYTCGGEHQHPVTVVEEFFITAALNLLQSDVEKTAMMESYLRFVGQFRDDHSEEYDLDTHESELWQYGATTVSLRRLMHFSFCLCGGVTQHWNNGTCAIIKLN